MNSALRNTDTLIGLLLFVAGLYAYTSTLAPTVIEGDAALFQFTPYVLGVTYPTGFPLYILLGKLWVTIFPFGEIAWRMNLFSALCSATALPLIYQAVRRFFALGQKEGLGGSERWAALLTVLTFATIPTFWRWSTEAKTYGLNILLFGGILYTLARALADKSQPGNTELHGGGTEKHRGWFGRYPLVWPTLLLGLFISVHNTGVLLIPGFLAMAWLYFRQHLSRAKSIILHLLLLALPGLFYLYIPIRAEWLIARYGRLEAIERGLLADFYHSGLAGWIQYYTGVGFTEGVVANWGLVPQQFFTVYVPLLIDDMTVLGVGLGIAGGLALAVRQLRLFTPLFLMYAVPIPFVIVYGQGEQSAFLLPSFLVFTIFVGNSIMLIAYTITKLMSHYRPTSHISHLISNLPAAILLVGLIPLLFLPQIQDNITWLTLKWNRDIYNEWMDALSHPLEPGAGMLAHWGDLTSFWYMQHAEGRRPDLHGVYPPTEEVVVAWYKRGNSDLYIAGPLQGWAAGIEERYHLIPWGRLVRIAPREVDPQNLLPALGRAIDVTFANKLRLLGLDYSPQAIAGYDYPVTLGWQTLAELPPETTVSLRFSQEGRIVTQLDDRLRSGWFPSEYLPANQPVLSYAQVPIPLGTLPGMYQLQLVTYTDDDAPWTLSDGSVVLDIGLVEIVPPPIGDRPDIGDYNTLPSHDFNSEIELLGYDYSVTRVGQGKGFAIRLLWQTKKSPSDNYTLLVEGLDANGDVLRSLEYKPVEGRSSTGSWQRGQFIRDQVDFVVPASAPPGQNALQVRLSWIRPDGSKLNLRRWGILPIDNGLNLGWLDITEKEGRIFELPQVQYPINANLESTFQLLGYNTTLQESDSSEAVFQFSRSTCASDVACRISLNFYWQGISETDLLYQVFLHVVDIQGNIVAQHDRVPGIRGKQPTTGWLANEVVLDPIEIALPAEMAAGQYTIRVGMYLPPDGPRLFILNEQGEMVSDFVDVGTIEIVKP